MAIGQSARSCTYTLILPQGVEIELIFAVQAAVSEIRANFQNCHIWACNLAIAKVPEVAHIPTFYLKGAKSSLFSLYRLRFLRYGPIFKIAIFGHETWPLAKVPEVAHLVSFYPRGVDISAYFCFTGSGFQDMGQFWAEPIAGVVMLLQWPFRGRPGLSAVYLQASGEIADD